jgi:hypothetical protein
MPTAWAPTIGRVASKVARAPELPRAPACGAVRVDGGHDHVEAGDAAVGDEHLLAVQHPVVAVADGPGAEAGDVGPGARLGDGERADLGLGGGAEQLGGPAGHLVRGAAGHQGDQGQPAAEDAQGDARAAPAELLDQQGLEDAGLVLADHPVEVHAVEADVGRLGKDRPGEVLGLVVVGRDRPDLLLGELAGPLLGGHLVFGEREADHGQVLSRTACYRSVTY